MTGGPPSTNQPIIHRKNYSKLFHNVEFKKFSIIKVTILLRPLSHDAFFTSKYRHRKIHFTVLGRLMQNFMSVLLPINGFLPQARGKPSIIVLKMLPSHWATFIYNETTEIKICPRFIQPGFTINDFQSTGNISFLLPKYKRTIRNKTQETGPS